jgi:hypothetical protein
MASKPPISAGSEDNEIFVALSPPVPDVSGNDSPLPFDLSAVPRKKFTMDSDGGNQVVKRLSAAAGKARGS